MSSMSSFYCEHCHALISDSPSGYVTGCEHYPMVGRCADCKKDIYLHDDDAGVCIHCGGRNRRVPNAGGEPLSYSNYRALKLIDALRELYGKKEDGDG